jgi:hypothetical protein
MLLLLLVLFQRHLGLDLISRSKGLIIELEIQPDVNKLGFLKQ